MHQARLPTQSILDEEADGIILTSAKLDFIHFQERKEQGKLAILYQEKREAYPAHG